MYCLIEFTDIALFECRQLKNITKNSFIRDRQKYCPYEKNLHWKHFTETLFEELILYFRVNKYLKAGGEPFNSNYF
jgi:hypothetical protein